jgi:hypothetical protein
VTPGPLAPARELLGDMLMELGRSVEASEEYRATLRRSRIAGMRSVAWAE